MPVTLPLTGARTALPVRLAAVMSLALCLAGAPGSASAADTPPPADDRPVVTLDAQATSRVPNDTAHATLFAEREAPDAAAATRAVQAVIDDALAEARTARGVETRSGGWATAPVIARDSRSTTGWRVRAELRLESKDPPALAALAGRLARRLSIGELRFSLSDAARQAEESRLLDVAIGEFRARAGQVAGAFGHRGWSVRDVAVQRGSEGPPMPVMAMRAFGAADKAEAAPLPIEGGLANVRVAITGSIRLER